MVGENANRSRRSAAYITSNACNECKRKKAKCDGQDPCSRCAPFDNISCRYEVPVRASKEALKAKNDEMQVKNDELQAYCQLSENIFGLLASGIQCDYILEALQKRMSLEDISQGLEMQGLAQQPLAWDRNTAYAANGRRLDGRGSDKDVAMEDSILYQQSWTNVTTDAGLISHLLSLYFCWEYPIFTSLSRPHFLTDFHSGRRRYCSSLLVNTILAVGYQFSDDSTRSNDSTLSVNYFSKEAERLLQLEPEIPCLTTIQSLGILSMLEASRGRSEHSTFYCGQAIRMTIEMGLHLNLDAVQLPRIEQEVRRATVWGASMLDHAWSLILGRIPHLSRQRIEVTKPVFETEERVQWIPYTGHEEPYDNKVQQESNMRSIYIGLCDLFEVVHYSLYVLYVPGKILGSRELLDIYTRYLAWHSSLPETLRQGQNSTPQVFFLHIYFNFAILLLFGPFIKLRIHNSEIVPFQLCIQAADTITSLLSSYRRLYSLRRTPCFTPIIALASSIMHAVQAEIQGSPNSTFLLGLSHLEGMTHSHSFARRSMEYLHILEQHRQLVAGVANEGSTAVKVGIHQYIKASVSFVEAGIENLPLDQADPFHTSIYAPFPTQILPSISFKIELQKLGFELVSTENV